jgi:hypothetical protein
MIFFRFWLSCLFPKLMRAFAYGLLFYHGLPLLMIDQRERAGPAPKIAGIARATTPKCSAAPRRGGSNDGDRAGETEPMQSPVEPIRYRGGN